MLTTDGLKYLTQGEPGIGGRIKQRPEDFVVEEIPLFEPEDRGDHLYVLVEKRRRLTTDVVRYFSRHFGVPRLAIGFAGLKDKHAVTRQWFSVEHAREDRARAFQDDHIQILDLRRHPTKLKRGNLRGNRFEIKVRQIDLTQVVRVKRMMEHLTRHGVPNFLGEQRFGYRRNNHTLGRLLLMGDLQGFLDEMLGRPELSEPQANYLARQAYERRDYKTSLQLWPTTHRFERQAIGPLSRGASPVHAVNGIDKTQLQFMVTAFQSAIFNRLLNQRVQQGLLDRLRPGDLAFKHTTRGIFEVRDAAVEQPRCDAMEISPTGPMWGHKMTVAGGEVGDAERGALLETGVSQQLLEESRYAPDGARRPFRMLVRNPQVSAGADEHGPYIHLGFDLDRGCFATILLREIMKNDLAEED